MEIFKLVGSIFVDSDEADKSLQKTDKAASGVGEKFLNGVKSAGKFAAGMVAASATAVTAITAFANKTASTCDQIDKMSQKIGISREGYQEWSYICSQCGMDVDKLQTGMKTLTTKMTDAAAGGKKSTEAFKKLGLSVKDETGKLKSQEQMFNETITALQGMEDETERAALASQLFGKAGVEMAPLLNAGAGAVDELSQKAHDLGMILDDETVDAGVNLTDTIDTLKRSLGGVLANLGGSVMPLVQKVADFLIENMPKISAVIGKLEPVITTLFNKLVPPLMDLVERLLPPIITLIEQMIPVIMPLLDQILPPIVTLMDLLVPPMVEIVEKLLPPLAGLLEPVLKLLDPLIQLLEPILDLVTSILDPIVELIDDLLTPLITKISELINEVLSPLKSILEEVGGVLSDTFKNAVQTVKTQVALIKTAFQGILDFLRAIFKGKWEDAWNAIKRVFKVVWDSFENIIKAPINFVIDGINLLIRGLNKIHIPDEIPVVGGIGFDIKEIPNLQAGGILEKGQTGFLEGNGAEAVVPLENNRRWIHAVAQDMQSAGIGGGRTDELLAAILDALEDVAGMGIFLDKDRLVGELLKPIDKGLGKIAAQKARG